VDDATLSYLVAFNSFPVAAQNLVGNRHAAGEADLSILSQLLHQVPGALVRLLPVEAFNSFPVAAKARGSEYTSTARWLSILSQLLR
jgi:hypothetical protein